MFYPTSLNLFLANCKAAAEEWRAQGHPADHPPMNLGFWAKQGVFTEADYWERMDRRMEEYRQAA